MNRYSSTKRAGMFGIIGNLFLLVIKLTIGLISKSQAMIADSFNSAGDIFASLMTTIGNKIASVPKDDNHNLGHGKAEYIFSMFISLAMMGVSLKILYDSIISIVEKREIIFSWWLIIVCIITIITKFVLYLYTKNVYRNHPNLLLKSNMIDHRNDCIITIFTTISITLSNYGIYYFDGLMGIFISIWIFIAGIKIFIESYNVLMDISIDDNTKKQILEIIKEYKEVKKVTDIYSIPTGYRYIIVFTIDVDGNMSTYASHQIADCLEIEIVSMIPKVEKVMIHVHPI